MAIGAAMAATVQAQVLPPRPGNALDHAPYHAIVRSYRVAVGDAAASRWSDMAGVPVTLRNEQPWAGQRVRSRWLTVATGRVSTSLYLVRSRRAPRGSLTRLIGERLSRKALGADLSFRPSDGTGFRLRAAMLSVRASPATAVMGAKPVRDHRLLLGAGIELPGLGAAMLDYVRIASNAGRPDRPVGGMGSRDGERAGAGPRLTLTGTVDSAAPVGLTLSIASLRRPDLDRIDSRAALAVQLRF